jgi:hypothetical protein
MPTLDTVGQVVVSWVAKPSWNRTSRERRGVKGGKIESCVLDQHKLNRVLITIGSGRMPASQQTVLEAGA